MYERSTIDRELRDLTAGVDRETTTDPPTGGWPALRARAAAIALREVQVWGNGALDESDPAALEHLTRYIRVGLGVGAEEAARDARRSATGGFAWSASFISYVMREAGAGDAFAYHAAHRGYIRFAKRQRQAGNTARPIWALRITEAAPRVGDLVANARCPSSKQSSCSLATYENIDDGTEWPTHVNIVVRLGSDAEGRFAEVAGGNRQSQRARRGTVKTSLLRLDADGFVRPTGGQRFEFFAIVQVGPPDGTAVAPPSPAPAGSWPAPSPANGGRPGMLAALGSLPIVGSVFAATSEVVDDVRVVAAVTAAIGRGDRDENSLADLALRTAHPELGRRKLRRDEQALIDEWKRWRDGLVRRLLSNSASLPVSRPNPVATTINSTPGNSSSGCDRRLLFNFRRRDAPSVPIWRLGPGVHAFQAGMSIDADGAPRAYHPRNTGLDYNGNGGLHTDKPWGVALDRHGRPVIQGPDQPAPGYYVSATALADPAIPKGDQRRYVDSSTVPYVALPNGLRQALKLGMGDLAFVLRAGRPESSAAILADIGPRGKLGEGSIALAQALGHQPFSSKGRASVGLSRGVVYVVFSGSGTGRPLPLPDIRRRIEALVAGLGGEPAIRRCFPA